MTSVLPPRRPLLSPPLYLLLLLGLGLGLVLSGLAALLCTMALLLGARAPMWLGFLSFLVPLALHAVGLWGLRRALIEAQHVGPFGEGLADQVRRGASSLLAAAALMVPLGGLGVWLLTPRAGQEGVTVNSALSASDALSMLVAALYWIAIPLLLLGLADWMDRGRRIVDRQREVV